MPEATNAIPMSPFRLGAFSPRHIAINAVNSKLHEFDMVTAIDNSDCCSANTYSTLPHWFNKNGKMYCQRVTMNLNSWKIFVNLELASMASIPTEPRLISGFVAPHKNPTTTKTIFWPIDGIVGFGSVLEIRQCSLTNCVFYGF